MGWSEKATVILARLNQIKGPNTWEIWFDWAIPTSHIFLAKQEDKLIRQEEGNHKFDHLHPLLYITLSKTFFFFFFIWFPLIHIDGESTMHRRKKMNQKKRWWMWRSHWTRRCKWGDGYIKEMKEEWNL